jgi:hypothetical protein
MLSQPHFQDRVEHSALNRNGAARNWMRAAPSVSVTGRLY